MRRLVFISVASLLLAQGEGALARAPRGKAPLMPPQFAQSDTSVASASVEKAQPVRLGLQLGGVGIAKNTSSPMILNQAFVGGRLFSRLGLGGRWYLIPSLGYYRMFTTRTNATQAENIVELAAGINYALFRLGPVGVMAGISQRLGIRFSADGSGAVGYGFYRVGPGVGVNIRISADTSILIGTDVALPLKSPAIPEWTSQAGLLFSL